MNRSKTRMSFVVVVMGAVAAWSAAARDTWSPPPEFTHHQPGEWINSQPLSLAELRGKVVMIEFWAFECVNCLKSKEWVEQVASRRAAAGLVVVGVHTPEWAAERSADNVRKAVARLGIHHPVMLDSDSSYWNALRNQYWPAFYLIGRDGLLYGSAVGEVRIGDGSAKRLEAALDALLAK
jgi:thiol-disulfide isomerase/thioredoxin